MTAEDVLRAIKSLEDIKQRSKWSDLHLRNDSACDGEVG